MGVSLASNRSMNMSDRRRITIRIGVAALIAGAMPWPGPHADRYLSLVAAALGSRSASPDAAFWTWVALLWIAYALIWVLALAVLRVFWPRFKRGRRR